MQQCLSEISTLQKHLRETTLELEAEKSRVDVERKLNRENVQENVRLKEEIYKPSTDSEGKDDQIKDLRSNIQTYVSEVKRIEDLLNSREHERGELLDQYKYLSDEVDKSDLRKLKALFRAKLNTTVLFEMATTRSTPSLVHKNNGSKENRC